MEKKEERGDDNQGGQCVEKDGRKEGVSVFAMYMNTK